MATIYVDNLPYEVRDGQNLLSACLSLGFNVPYFCWHPAMHSVGACRQCAVKQFRDENDKKGLIVMSCMTAATDGTRISIDDPDARQFRAAVIEFLMMNHPHDCPVCDEGGECHLQDMTVMTGHVYRKYRFKKRTWRNQNLGPFVNHEMNRCIECYRCLRFYRDYAGGRDFDVLGISLHVYFGRHRDGVLENEFSGNLVEVCPTGVFTDKTFKKHYTRKWDLQTAPSVCVHCGIGCNTIPGERYGILRRIRNRYNHDVNGYFLCDRGRYGYEFVNSEHRIHTSFMKSRRGGDLKPITRRQALDHICDILVSSSRIIGIGSPRASIEANFALRVLVGEENFYSGVSEKHQELLRLILSILRCGQVPSASLHDVATSDAALVLCEDAPNTAPMLALALRQSARQKLYSKSDRLKIPRWKDNAVRIAVQFDKAPFYILSSHNTRLDDIALRCFRGSPQDLARLGFAIAGSLSSEAPQVPDLPMDLHGLAEEIGNALHEANQPLIVSGMSSGDPTVMQAAANVAKALRVVGRSPKLCFAVPECNSMGIATMVDSSLDSAIARVLDGQVDTVVILENDLYRRSEEHGLKTFFESSKHVIVIDHLLNRTVSHADVTLAAGTFAESDGTFINNEGRAQRFFKVMNPANGIQESWRWLRDIMVASGRLETGDWRSMDDVVAAVAENLSVFEGIRDAAPTSDFRMVDMKIAREPHRYSGRTSMHAHIDVHEPTPPHDTDAPFSFSMEGYQEQPPPPLIPRFWAPAWNSVQAVNKYQTAIGEELTGGTPGSKLIKAAEVDQMAYFTNMPEPFESRESEWLVIPIYHVFGSEELSMAAPGIAEIASSPYLGISVDDAETLNLMEGEIVEVALDKTAKLIPTRVLANLSKGVTALTVGLPGLGYIDLPVWGRFNRENSGDMLMVLTPSDGKRTDSKSASSGG